MTLEVGLVQAMAIKSVPQTQTPDRLLNQLQQYIINPLNILINSFNVEPVRSSSTGLYSTTSTTFVKVPQLTASFTSSGRPIRISFLSSNIQNDSSYFSGSLGVFYLQILRDGQVISFTAAGTNGALSYIPAASFDFVDDSAPVGPHTYSVQVYTPSGTLKIYNVLLRLSQE